jgi:hypothetical protein
MGVRRAKVFWDIVLSEFCRYFTELAIAPYISSFAVENRVIAETRMIGGYKLFFTGLSMTGNRV